MILRLDPAALEAARLGGGRCPRPWRGLAVVGADSARFLHSQLSSDVRGLAVGHFEATAWLDRSGRLRAIGVLGRPSEDRFLLAGDEQAVSDLADGLTAAVIADRVELETVAEPLWLHLGPAAFEHRQPEHLEGHWAGEPALLGAVIDALEPLDEAFLEGLEILAGQPRIGRDAALGQLINETRLVELAVSFDKGCYLGQETVAKVASRRGALRFPVLFEVDGALPTTDAVELDGKRSPILAALELGERRLLEVALHRDHRVQGKRLPLGDGTATVRLLPLEAWDDRPARAERLVHAASRRFANDQEQQAIELLERALAFAPECADAYETLGVIFGRHERYEEALALMRRLETVDPDSVMARSNASLYLMKLGRIAEAEDEKAKAAELGMQKFLADKVSEDEARQAAEQRRAEEERQVAMFHQILEIDPEDALAHFSLGRILLRRGEADSARDHLETVLRVDPGYSAAYLDFGKALRALGDHERSLAIFNKGVEVAASKGDLMVANQIQALLADER